MRRVPAIWCVVSAAALAAGCGGASHNPAAAAPPAPPVAEQVRDALRGALHNPLTVPAIVTARPRLPYAAVSGCTGPAGGAAGTYRCATTPLDPGGVHTVTVDVHRDGRWATHPIPLQTTIRGHRTTAMTGVWGFGLRMPR
jgi:hypothetical protein